MKKLILTLGIFLSGIVCIHAQEAQGDNTEKQTQTMVTKLTQICTLTSDQVSKVTPIIKQFVANRESNKEKYASDQAELNEANKTNKENMNSQLKSVLSEDQEAKLKEFQKQKMEEKRAEKAKGE